MPADSSKRSRIDEFLPIYSVRASYSIRILAPRSVVYQCLLRSDFSEHWLVRLLMTLRTGKRMPRNPALGDIRRRLQGSGFILLSEVPDEELVLGVAGRFWHPNGGRCLDLDVDGFVDFCRPGYAKAALNFSLVEQSPESTVLSTETRIHCFDSARWKFRAYWILVAPFSGLMRWAILRQVKDRAETGLTGKHENPGDHEPLPMPKAQL